MQDTLLKIFDSVDLHNKIVCFKSKSFSQLIKCSNSLKYLFISLKIDILLFKFYLKILRFDILTNNKYFNTRGLIKPSDLKYSYYN